MTTGSVPWEHGSDFERRSFEEAPNAPPPWSGAPVWMTARGALQALIVERGWRRLWLPSYFCHDVTFAAIEVGVRVHVYPDDPLEDRMAFPEIADEPGEALLIVNTFGRRLAPAAPLGAQHCELIEDHSHDPFSNWAQRSAADWCLASLRKALPIPVGGVVWSPRGHPVPEPQIASEQVERTTRDRMVGMTLKQQYLAGEPVRKAEFRRLLTETEACLVKLPSSAAPSWASDFVGEIPFATWRRQRQENLAFLAESLANHDAFRLLKTAHSDQAMLGAVAVFNSAAASVAVEKNLIDQSIYPARLWSLDKVALDLPRRSVELGSRLLFLHCDGRYDRSDLERVVKAVVAAAEGTV